MSDLSEDPLLPLIVGFLAPLFFPITKDIERARQAAIATIQRIQGSAHSDLINIAQIIAFGLAALNTLGYAMEDSLDPKLLIKLNASAAALSRCEDRNRRFLGNRPSQKPVPKPITPEEDAAITAEAENQLKISKNLQATVRQITAEQRNPATAGDAAKKGFVSDAKSLDWVLSYAMMAEECLRDPDSYACGCRREANVRARLLNECAFDVLVGKPADISGMPGFAPKKATSQQPAK